MDNLFMKTSSILRDQLVCELKTQNDLLRKQIKKNDGSLIGEKARVYKYDSQLRQRVILVDNGVIVHVAQYRIMVMYDAGEAGTLLHNAFPSEVEILWKM